MKNSNDLKVKKELDTVYIDSSGKKHLDYMKALCAQAQINMCEERKLQKKQRIMNVIEQIMQILKSENWGIFYKNQPIRTLDTNDGGTLYEVNQVDECEIEKAITEALTWEDTETNPISSQNKNSMIG